MWRTGSASTENAGEKERRNEVQQLGVAAEKLCTSTDDLSKEQRECLRDAEQSHHVTITGHFWRWSQTARRRRKPA